MSSYFSNIHISDTQISHIIHSSSHIYIYIYIYINAAVSCKRYPPSLPYIIIVQTCGKRWDLPKFVDVLSVNLGFSQSLSYFDVHQGYKVLTHCHMCLISIVDSLPSTKTLICHGNLRGLKSSPNFGRETRPGLRPDKCLKVICQVFFVVLVNFQNAAAPEFAVLVVRPRISRFFSFFFPLYLCLMVTSPFFSSTFPWNQSFH